MAVNSVTYEISSNKVKKPHLIALLSDFSYESNQDNQMLIDLAYNLKNERPEVICLMGDFFHNIKLTWEDQKYKFWLEWLEVISYIAPVCIIKGERDYLYKQKREWQYFDSKDLFMKMAAIPRVVVFHYPYCKIKLGELVITGFDLAEQTIPYYLTQNESMTSYLKTVRHKINMIESSLKMQDYNILLFHSPNALFRDLNHPKYSLFLAGHNLNGYVPNLLDNLTGNASWGLLNKQGRILAPHCRNGEELKKDDSLWGITAPPVLSNVGLIRKRKPQIRYVNIKNKS